MFSVQNINLYGTSLHLIESAVNKTLKIPPKFYLNLHISTNTLLL